MDFQLGGPPGRENQGGTRSNGGGAIHPHVSAPLLIFYQSYQKVVGEEVSPTEDPENLIMGESWKTR